MEIVPVEEKDTPIQKGSYKETLLAGPRLEGDHETSFIMDDDEPNPEDKWYKDDEDGVNAEKPFNLCPMIPVSKEEFEKWCKPWKNALMVKVLGKRVTFAFMEQRLRRDWEGKDEEDYLMRLWKGPGWSLGTTLLYEHRSEQWTENLSTIGNPIDDVGAGSNPPVDDTDEHGDDQNRKFGDPQN
ncbi:hypothetical protein Ahy_B03g063557 isoform A [Arachis hypogaea]|uniref:DUF4283 domain-containing protein n=1 Tax=Arachis hypogaea TaxID=3818 RepID=A0A444ZY01_ARAHY|nr:hypothetical protein Ahy_B03g063557 isoform A [Arachis hypogaea]